MNQGPHLHHSNLTVPLTSASRKRMRENETPSQRTKREKAAERQRRKRERDRQAGLNSSAVQTGDQQAPISTISAPDLHQQDMSPEEISRRDRVRAAARERQRKHRALVKQRKMRELGLDPMGNELIPGMEEVHYPLHPDGRYAVLPPELQHVPPPPPHGMPEPPFPQGQIPGGQTFASTLLLSFSCTPLLKQHLLRTLSMTNDELASLEPIIAQAWDHWDQQVCAIIFYLARARRDSLISSALYLLSPPQRRIHFAQQHAGKQPDGTDPTAPFPPPPVDAVYGAEPGQDFRARFHRSLVAPTPFRTFPPDAHPGLQGPSPNPGSGPTGEPIDPHLVVIQQPADGNKLGAQSIDPALSRARAEATGRLEQR
jgi:hypothetical protein